MIDSERFFGSLRVVIGLFKKTRTGCCFRVRPAYNSAPRLEVELDAVSSQGGGGSRRLRSILQTKNPLATPAELVAQYGCVRAEGSLSVL